MDAFQMGVALDPDIERELLAPVGGGAGKVALNIQARDRLLCELGWPTCTMGSTLEFIAGVAGELSDVSGYIATGCLSGVWIPVVGEGLAVCAAAAGGASTGLGLVEVGAQALNGDVERCSLLGAGMDALLPRVGSDAIELVHSGFGNAIDATCS